MAGKASGDLQCPVCTNTFTNPKILPCNHLACRDCLLSRLQKEGTQAGCPLCKATILSSAKKGQGQGRLASAVDSLPTDWITTALVDNQTILAGPHVCAMCENNVTATSYCFACRVKLCPTCTSYHEKLPGTKEHNLGQLSKLTEKQLAANRQATCNNHANRPAEMYCSSHHQLICMECCTTNHRRCAEVKAIAEAAKEKRSELKQRSQKLKAKGEGLGSQVKNVKDRFKDMRSKTKDVFDNIQQNVEKRREQVNELIQMEEDSTMTSLTEIEKSRDGVDSISENMDHLLTSAPDDALLMMQRHLKSRLTDLESESKRITKVKNAGDVVFDGQILSRLKSDLYKLGEVQKPQYEMRYVSDEVATNPQYPVVDLSDDEERPQYRIISTSEDRIISTSEDTTVAVSGALRSGYPRGAELAKVLKVGDKVRRGRDWALWNGVQDTGGTGTGRVTAINSQIIPFPGWVDVQWDTGEEDSYRMGCGGRYELDLA